MKTYTVNKKRLLIINMLSLLVVFAMTLLPYLVFKKSEILLFSIIPVVITILWFPSLKSAFKMSVTLTDDKIICRNFTIGMNVFNAEVGYEQITRIAVKNKLVLIIAGTDEKHPIVIDKSFLDYQNLVRTVCNKCKSFNPQIEIDPKVYELIEKE